MTKNQIFILRLFVVMITTMLLLSSLEYRLKIFLLTICGVFLLSAGKLDNTK